MKQKFILDNKDLAQILQVINSGVTLTKAGPPPTVLFQGSKHAMTITNFNQNGLIRAAIPADLGDTVINRRLGFTRLSDVTPLLEEPISFEPSGAEWAMISSGKARFRIPEMPIETGQFDADIPAKLDKSVKMSCELFRQMFHSATVAVGKVHTGNFALRDIHVVIKKDQLIMEGCDGAEIMRAVTTLDKPANDEDFLIPQAVMSPILNILKTVGIVEFAIISNQRFLIRCGNYTIITRTSALKFPDVNQLIPKDCSTKAEVTSKNLVETMRRAMKFTDEGTLKLSFEGSSLAISAESGIYGSFLEPVELDNEVVKHEIMINGKRLLDCLSELSSKKVEISVGDKYHQVMVKPIESKLDLTYVVVSLWSKQT